MHAPVLALRRESRILSFFIQDYLPWHPCQQLFDFSWVFVNLGVHLLRPKSLVNYDINLDILLRINYKNPRLTITTPNMTALGGALEQENVRVI